MPSAEAEAEVADGEALLGLPVVGARDDEIDGLVDRRPLAAQRRFEPRDPNVLLPGVRVRLSGR
jgi:hypothetical protein